MTIWHPSGQPFTPYNAPRYWANVLQNIAHSSTYATTPVRNGQPNVVEYQPPIASAKVITSGLADGPTGN